MDTERHRRAGEIFLGLLELPEAERKGFIDRECGGDLDLKAEVESLYEADRKAKELFPTPPTPSPDEQETDRPAEPMPEWIGSYRILRQLGKGGMGIVYLAEQEQPLKRRVALKRMISELTTPRFIRRFRREAQALALMSHPNIASIYDAATTTEGHPYLVMEYIEGQRIDEYCDSHRLSLRDRIELFIPVCEGIQHAHQKGRIHRDLKPWNVLVQQQDGRSVPKIIDFGITKATDEDPSSTELGWVMGTPAYMSPEQADPDSQDIDTRTDVYSLGVMLYELLAGVLPLDAAKKRQEMLRLIREVTPPLASKRVEALSDKAAAAAEARGIDPRTLASQLRGDLDWILSRAMEKERDRRYATPSELAADLQRYLSDEPVLAGPPSRVYRLRKFVRRHRIGVAAAALLVATLLIGMAGTTVGLVRARRAERTAAAARVQATQQAERAKREADVADRIAHFLVDLFHVPDPSESRGNEVTAREILDRGAEKIAEDAGMQPRVRARLMLTMSSSYRGLGFYEQAQPLAEQALATLNQVAPKGDLDVASALDVKGSLLKEQGKMREAKQTYEQALAIRRRYLPANSLGVAISLNNIGVCDYEDGRDAEAIPILEQALKIRKALLPSNDLDVADSLMNLSLPLSNSENEADRARARDMLQDAIDVYRVKRPNSLDLAQALNNLGVMYAEAEQYAQATPLMTEALHIHQHVLPAGHQDIGSDLMNIANVELSEKRYDIARLHFQEGLKIFARAGIPDHQYFAYAKNNFACLHIAVGQHARGRQLHREALAILDPSNPNHINLAAQLEESFAGYLEEAGLHNEAVAAMERAQALQKRARVGAS